MGITGGLLWYYDISTSVRILPLTLKDCIFFIVDNCFFEESTTSNYKKVSESKQGCKVGLILTNNNETYYTEENKPDFIINTITGEFLIP
jgi:hypothetical protein